MIEFSWQLMRPAQQLPTNCKDIIAQRAKNVNNYFIYTRLSISLQEESRQVCAKSSNFRKNTRNRRTKNFFPLNIAIAKSKPASGYFDSNVGAVVYYSAKHESGAKVGQLNFLFDVIVNQIGLGADNANLRRRFLRPAVEFALSSPGIGEQHQVPVFSIVIS